MSDVVLGHVPGYVEVALNAGEDYAVTLHIPPGATWPDSLTLEFTSGQSWPVLISGEDATVSATAELSGPDRIPSGTGVSLVAVDAGARTVWLRGRVTRG